MQKEGRNKMNRFQTTCRAGGKLGVSETEGGGAEQGGHPDFQQTEQVELPPHEPQSARRGGGGGGGRGWEGRSRLRLFTQRTAAEPFYASDLPLAAGDKVATKRNLCSRKSILQWAT